MEHSKLNIVKIGSGVLEDAALMSQTLKNLNQLPGGKILVHGGGEKATLLCKQLGISSKMHEGRRITDSATLEVVTMVYGGLVNKKVVCEMQKIGINALGLSGADGNLIQANKRPPHPIDFGFVGDIESVNDNLLCQLLHLNLVPTICALSHDKAGQLLNTNADTIARHIAISMQQHFEIELYYVFEKGGVLFDPEEERSIISSLDYQTFQALKEKQIIHNGMIPKLANAFEVILNSSISIKIGSPTMLENPKKGTKIIK